MINTYIYIYTNGYIHRSRSFTTTDKNVMVRQEEENVIIMGFPIPLRYVNPNLKFYPLVLPQNYVYIKKEQCFNNTHVNVKLNDRDQLYFVNLLMTKLNREYTIIGDYLIDMTRKEYRLSINRKDNKFSIQDYYTFKPFKYVTEKFFKPYKVNDSFPKVNPEKLKYNFFDNDNDAFIQEHCERIVAGTLQMEKLLFHLIYQGLG